MKGKVFLRSAAVKKYLVPLKLASQLGSWLASMSSGVRWRLKACKVWSITFKMSRYCSRKLVSWSMELWLIRNSSLA